MGQWCTNDNIQCVTYTRIVLLVILNEMCKRGWSCMGTSNFKCSNNGKFCWCQSRKDIKYGLRLSHQWLASGRCSQLTGYLLSMMITHHRDTCFPIVVLNVCEAEVISLSSACEEAVYLRQMCDQFICVHTSSTTLYIDCKCAVALSKDNWFRNWSKHISLRWSYVTERQRPDVAEIVVISVGRRITLMQQTSLPRLDHKLPWHHFRTSSSDTPLLSAKCLPKV